MSALSPVARALLAWLQERPAAGEGSLKSWGQTRRPSLTLTQVEVRAAELVDTGLVTREVRPDGRSVYRARERNPEPPPVEVVTEPSPTPPPASVKKAKKSPIVYVNQCSVCGRKDGAPGRCAFCHELGYEEPEAPEVPAPCAECTRLAEALLSWERLWGVNGTDLAAMEERVQTAERERDEARAAERGLQRQDVTSYVRAEEATARLAQVTAERDQLAAALAKAKAATPTPTPAEPALSALARLPVEQRRLVGLALQELSLEALGGALGAARAEAFAARPDLAPRLSENAAAVLKILSPDRGQTPREIGKKSGINQHSVHSALRSLEKRGLATNATYGFWRRAKS